MDKLDKNMKSITIDDVEYGWEDLSDKAQNQLDNIRFADWKILQN